MKYWDEIEGRWIDTDNKRTKKNKGAKSRTLKSFKRRDKRYKRALNSGIKSLVKIFKG